jgi:exopolysaccharide biosynthesis polyprenyl glycosylphosphotransferase
LAFTGGRLTLTAQPNEDLAVVAPLARPTRVARRGVFGGRFSSLEVPLPRAANWERHFVLSLLALDIVVVGGAVGGGTHLRFHEVANPLQTNTAMSLLLGPIWVALLAISGAYERERINLANGQFKAIFEASVRMAAIVAFLVYLTNTEVSRGFYLFALPGGFFLLVLGRVGARALLHRARKRGNCLHRVLAVGQVSDIEHLVQQLEHRDHHGLHVVGACAIAGDRTEIAPGVPIVGVPSDARRAAAEVRADTVAVTSSGVLGREGLRRLAWQLEGSDTGLLLTPELTDVAGPRVNVRPVGDLSLLQVSEPKFSGASRFLKSAFDRSVAALALLALSPVLLCIAVLIKLDSRGTVFFRQTRSGLSGKPFSIYKFRSMVPAAEDLLIDLTDQNEGKGTLFKIHRDPRVTRVGRVMRRLSLDELPQLWNVVRGHMSLVGPRPPLPSEVERYADDTRRRLLVKPGLTGLWQVSGRSDLSWEESVRLDLYYVENWSFVLDLMILARTVFAVAAGRGAY